MCTARLRAAQHSGRYAGGEVTKREWPGHGVALQVCALHAVDPCSCADGGEPGTRVGRQVEYRAEHREGQLQVTLDEIYHAGRNITGQHLRGQLHVRTERCRKSTEKSCRREHSRD